MTSGAPQRLFRSLRDSVLRFRFVPIEDREPQIIGQAIGETGTTEGWLFGERYLADVLSPYAIYRVAGVVFLLMALFSFLTGLASQGGGMLWGFIFAIVFVAIGAALVRSHQFVSELIYVHLKGEVYGSGLAVGTRLPAEVADSHRRSIISEMRLSLYATGIRSRNYRENREIVSAFPSSSIDVGFRGVLDDLTTNILPKVVLQKSWEQTRHEFAAPVIEKHVVHEVLVRCGYCGSLNPQGSRHCGSCGGALA